MRQGKGPEPNEEARNQRRLPKKGAWKVETMEGARKSKQGRGPGNEGGGQNKGGGEEPTKIIKGGDQKLKEMASNQKPKESARNQWRGSEPKGEGQETREVARTKERGSEPTKIAKGRGQESKENDRNQEKGLGAKGEGVRLF